MTHHQASQSVRSPNNFASTVGGSFKPPTTPATGTPSFLDDWLAKRQTAPQPSFGPLPGVATPGLKAPFDSQPAYAASPAGFIPPSIASPQLPSDSAPARPEDAKKQTEEDESPHPSGQLLSHHKAATPHQAKESSHRRESHTEQEPKLPVGANELTKNISSNEVEKQEVSDIAAELKQELQTDTLSEVPEKPASVTTAPHPPEEADDTIYIDQEGNLRAKA